MKNPKNAYTKAKKNTFDSTFIQKIKFCHGKEMTGYSQNDGFSEKNNKSSVLINMILRMYRGGYLDLNNPDKDQIMYMEYYLNLHSAPKLIYRLYYDYYEAFSGAEIYRPVVEFLDSFYIDVARAELSVQQVYKKYYHSQYSIVVDPMDHKPQRFITLKSLENYIHRMYNKKLMTLEQCSHFKRKYIEFHGLNN